MTELFIVVENAGYERERDIRSFDSLSGAYAFMKKQYNADDLESLHVDVAVERDGERTYEL